MRGVDSSALAGACALTCALTGTGPVSPLSPEACRRIAHSLKELLSWGSPPEPPAENILDIAGGSRILLNPVRNTDLILTFNQPEHEQ